MASLIHTKNISNPAFNLNDTITINRDNLHSGRTSKPSIETRSKMPFNKKTLQLSLLSNTSSHFYPSPQDEPALLHQVHSAQTSPTNQHITPKKPYAPLEAIISPKFGAPSPKNMPSLRLVKNKTVSPTFVDRFPVTDFTMFDTSQTPSKPPVDDVKTKVKFKNLSIGGAKDDKFKQYLDYLVKVDASSPKGDFEGRLRDKCRVKLAKKSVLNPLELEVPSLVKLPQSSNYGLSAILSPKDANYLAPLTTGDKDTERHCSIFKGRKQTLVLHRSLSPVNSQHESVITMSEVKNNPVVPQEKKFSVRSSKTLAFAHSGSRFSRLNEKRDCDHVLSELALNLQELFQILGKHPVKMAEAIDDITAKNPKITALLLPKFHKVADYDAAKLEQKFASIEVITEALSIPMKIQKSREGITLVEQNLIDELGLLNKKMEEYSLVKKSDQLQAVEDKIVQSKDKLHEFQMKLLADLKKGKNPDTFNNLRIFLEKDLTLSANISYDSSPISAVNEYQAKNGDFKLLSKKNLTQAKNVESMFTKWMKQPHEFKP